LDSGYRQEAIGLGRVRFTVDPAPAPVPRAGPSAVAGLAAALILAATLRFDTPAALAVRAAAAVLGAGWVHALVRRALAARLARARTPGGTFVVSAWRIETAGGTIARERIRRLVVTNAASSAHAVSFALCADVHGVLTPLAGGMEEPTALGLLADVSRVLRVGRRPVGNAPAGTTPGPTLEPTPGPTPEPAPEAALEPTRRMP
jgi:hypothetical protein